MAQIRILKYGIRAILVLCLTILIFAGSVPLLIQSSEAEKRGLKVCKTPKGDLFIPIDQECPKGSTASYSGKLAIEFIEASGHSRELTLTEAHAESEISGCLNQEGRFDLSSTSGHGACSIFHPSNAHHVFADTPKFHLTGDTRGLAFTTDLSLFDICSIPNPIGSGFVLHSGNSGFFNSEGHGNNHICEVPNCPRHWQWIITLSPTLVH